MLDYPYKLSADTNGAWLITFPDIPEAASVADTEAQAQSEALSGLESALEFYFEDGRPVPMPGRVKRGFKTVSLSASMTVKVLLLNEMLAQKVRPAELARRLGTTPQEVNRLTNLRHATKIDGLAAAFTALGKRLTVQVA